MSSSRDRFSGDFRQVLKSAPAPLTVLMMVSALFTASLVTPMVLAKAGFSLKIFLAKASISSSNLSPLAVPSRARTSVLKVEAIFSCSGVYMSYFWAKSIPCSMLASNFWAHSAAVWQSSSRARGARSVGISEASAAPPVCARAILNMNTDTDTAPMTIPDRLILLVKFIRLCFKLF